MFNTGMVGYPESLTDPSYRGQILVFTFPMMGNYGVPGEELDEWGLPKYFESNEIHVAGVIVADYSWEYSHWAARKSLSEWLKVRNGLFGCCLVVLLFAGLRQSPHLSQDLSVSICLVCYRSGRVMKTRSIARFERC